MRKTDDQTAFFSLRKKQRFRWPLSRVQGTYSAKKFFGNKSLWINTQAKHTNFNAVYLEYLVRLAKPCMTVSVKS
jgi:hypothetical protein